MIRSIRENRWLMKRREWLTGYLFASPWLIGFFAFGLIPIALSFYYSLCRYDVLRPAMFIGLENYRQLLFDSPLFYLSIYNTLYYTALRVPLAIIGSLLLALLVARPRRGMGAIRTAYYLPSIVSGVALSVLWMWLYNPKYGLVNEFLGYLGVPGPLWIQSAEWSKPALVFMGLWAIGGGRMIVFIAGLNGISRDMYESALIDGAGWWHRFWAITVPQLSGVLFLLTVVEVIGSFQVFTEAYVMTRGGPLNSTLFYNLELYNKAFLDYQMGLASAMAWLLFIGTMAVTLAMFKFLGSRVYYEAAKPK